MNKLLIIFLFCLASTNCFAIEYYVPGETLWVWAKTGLNIRELPDTNSKIVAKIENGSKVVTLDYQDRALPYSIEEIKKMSGAPNFKLEGYWAKIQYGDKIGFVFDAYLSHLPTMVGHQDDKQNDEDFHVTLLKKRHKIIQQIGENKYDANDHKFVRYRFDEGYIIDISGGSGNWGKEMLFPNNLSLIEGYLIYAHTMKRKEDRLLEKGKDYLIFEIDTGTLTIKKAGSFLVMYEEHRC